jgi:hypothetical protein
MSRKEWEMANAISLTAFVHCWVGIPDDILCHICQSTLSLVHHAEGYTKRKKP